MTVGKLKNYLNDLLYRLEDEDEEAEIKMVSNTYFLGHPHYFLGIAGYDGGYINLDNLEIESKVFYIQLSDGRYVWDIPTVDFTDSLDEAQEFDSYEDALDAIKEMKASEEWTYFDEDDKPEFKIISKNKEY